MANKKTYTASETLVPIPEIPTTVMNHIYFMANSMIGKSNLVEADRCDIIQELSLAVLKARSRYKPSPERPKGTAFFDSVVDHAMIDMYRKRIRRGQDTPTIPLGDCLDEDEKRTTGSFTPSIDDFEQRMLCQDVREVVAAMSDNLRRICELLMDGHNTNSISHILGIPESTVRTLRIPEIRAIFRSHEIKF